METKLFEGETATARLAELDLQADGLNEVVIKGEMARAAWTRHHPRVSRGQMWWQGIVHALRLWLSEQGWEGRDTRNLPVIVSPDGRHAIAVSSGDINTGRLGAASPQTRNPKGTATLAAIAMNSRQLSLFPPSAGADPASAPEMLTWILLVTRDATGVRFELSLPAAIARDGRVTEWAERILFAPIPHGRPQVVSPPEAEPAVEVAVARKS